MVGKISRHAWMWTIFSTVITNQQFVNKPIYINVGLLDGIQTGTNHSHARQNGASTKSESARLTIAKNTKVGGHFRDPYLKIEAKTVNRINFFIFTQ